MPSVIITGGTRGIGRSLVNKFASEGFDIATCSRNEKELESLKKNLQEKFPDIKIFISQCDVSVKSQIVNFGENAVKELGVPDALINNAGIFIPGKIKDEEDGIFERQININVAAAYHLTRKIIQGMIAKKNGYIFNFCSTASIKPYINGGSYCISKFAILGFSKVLREELKEFNIRVSSVLPGATDTSSWAGTDLPPERFINPDDIANMVYHFYNTPATMNVEEIIIRPLLGDIE